MSIRSGIRKLPFPPTSHFTHDVVKKIREIPNEDLKYDKEEIKWMQRAVENLDHMIKLESSCGMDTSLIEKRKSQIEETLELCRKISPNTFKQIEWSMWISKMFKRFRNIFKWG